LALLVLKEEGRRKKEELIVGNCEFSPSPPLPLSLS
jgi:hypothetical protein